MAGFVDKLNVVCCFSIKMVKATHEKLLSFSPYTGANIKAAKQYLFLDLQKARKVHSL